MGDRGYENGEGPIIRRVAEAVANDNRVSIEALLSGAAPFENFPSEVRAMLAVWRMLDSDASMLRALKDRRPQAEL